MRLSKYLFEDLPEDLRLAQETSFALLDELREKMEESEKYMQVVGKKRKGTGFGDLALQYDPLNPSKDVRRYATITTTRDSIFAILNKMNYREILDKIQYQIREEKMKFFYQIPFCRAMSTKVRKDMLVFMEEQTYVRDQIVFYEGTEANFVLFVKSGEFEITRNFDEDNSYLSKKTTLGPLDRMKNRVAGSEEQSPFQKGDFVSNFLKEADTKRAQGKPGIRMI